MTLKKHGGYRMETRCGGCGRPITIKEYNTYGYSELSARLPKAMRLCRNCQRGLKIKKPKKVVANKEDKVFIQKAINIKDLFL